MRIGLMGFGTVGQGVYEIASSREDMQVARVLCLQQLQLPDAQVTQNFEDILHDDSIDTVVEVIGGLHPAKEYVVAAMQAGKNVVTANKAMISHFYDELTSLAREMGVCLRCTAAVGGGISWLSELERAGRVETVRQVSGIMNGTCNYILDSMTRLGIDYQEALREAQRLGYAEANPSTDVDGLDTWHKITISANIAFRTSLDMNAIPVAGIRNITSEDVEEFTKRALVCKLIATAKISGGEVAAFVQPTLCPLGEPEAAVPSNFNLITMIGNTSGRHSFFGQGAGRYPTAYNVVQDLVDILSGRGFYCSCKGKKTVSNHCRMEYYVRGEADAWLQANTAGHWGSAVITGPVSVADMHRYLAEHPDAFIAALAERKE